MLSIFVFETLAEPQKCIEFMLKVVSAQTPLENYQINSTDFYVDGKLSSFAVADGHSSSGKQLPFHGIYVGIPNHEYVYIFAWDAFGENAQNEITDDALEILESVELK